MKTALITLKDSGDEVFVVLDVIDRGEYLVTKLGQSQIRPVKWDNIEAIILPILYLIYWSNQTQSFHAITHDELRKRIYTIIQGNSPKNKHELINAQFALEFNSEAYNKLSTSFGVVNLTNQLIELGDQTIGASIDDLVTAFKRQEVIVRRKNVLFNYAAVKSLYFEKETEISTTIE